MRDRFVAWLLFPAICGLLVTACAAIDSNQATVEQKVAAGSSIRLHLESGGYTIQATDSDKVVVTYHTSTAEQLKEVHVEMKPSGSGLAVFVRDTPNSNFSATIEVPRRSNLWIRLTAGDLQIEDIEGDKDIESNAGNMVIQVPHPEQYGHVDGSVYAGDLDASAFNVEKGGLFRSFDKSGPGKYRLHAHMMAGNLTLKSGT